MTTALPRYRALAFGVTRGLRRDAPDGTTYLQAEQPLAPHAHRLTDRLVHWAAVAPQRSFMARRERLADGRTGDWQHLSYADALDAARRIGQALLDRGLNAERPVLIVSENDLEHAQLALGCLYAGIPWAPASPAYSLVSQDFEKLRHIVDTLTPGLVFATDGARYAKAIAAAVRREVTEREVGLVADGRDDGRLARAHGTHEGFVVEAPKVFHRAAPSSDDDEVDAGDGVGLVSAAPATKTTVSEPGQEKPSS